MALYQNPHQNKKNRSTKDDGLLPWLDFAKAGSEGLETEKTSDTGISPPKADTSDLSDDDWMVIHFMSFVSNDHTPGTDGAQAPGLIPFGSFLLDQMSDMGFITPDSAVRLSQYFGTRSTPGFRSHDPAKLRANLPPETVDAAEQAELMTGVPVDYLLVLAAVESGCRPDVGAETSSALGLCQFIKSTWLAQIEKHGHKYGIDPETMSREAILDLRRDPRLSIFMAAEFTRENEQYMERHLINQDRAENLSATDRYMAHFMGAGNAARFLNALDSNPLMVAADLFPAAAKANRAVFYDRTGAALPLAAIYDRFAGKFSDVDHAATAAVSRPESDFALN